MRGRRRTCCSSSPTTTPRSRRSPPTTTSRRHSATGSTTPGCSSSQAPARSSRRASSRPCSSGRCRQTADAKYDLAQAKSWLAKSGVGHPSLKLTYPTGLTVNGLSFDDAAARLEQYLDQIGINVTLQPESLQVGLGSYRAGTEALGLWFWGPDYPDPDDYLDFAPGHLVGLRAGWTASDSAAGGPAVAALANQAATTTGVSARQAIFEKFQQAMNKNGPFIPLIQPAEVVVGTKDIKNLQANGVWLVDLRNLS